MNKCKYCDIENISQQANANHMKHCFKNPNLDENKKKQSIKIKTTNEQKRYYIDKPCSKCGNLFKVRRIKGKPAPLNEKKCCSQKCSKTRDFSPEMRQHISDVLKAKYPEKIKVIKKVTRNKKQYFCKNCNIIIGRQREFCSQECKNNFFWNITKTQIENNECKNVNGRAYKKYLVEKFGHKCSICGVVDWMNKPMPMILDHIDGHSTNNNITNLRLVCSNCDTQLPTYKSKNKGNGRKFRKKYYT